MSIESAILFTGPPGVGKSTAIRRVVTDLGNFQLTGFLSSEIRIEGQRQGFQVESIRTKKSGLLASPSLPGEPRFGTLLPDGRRRLGVSLEFLEQELCPEIREYFPRADLVVIDEIGPIQALSVAFRRIIEDILDKKIPMIASIAMAEDEWVASIRQNPNVLVIELSTKNREFITEAAAHHFRTRLTSQ